MTTYAITCESGFPGCPQKELGTVTLPDDALPDAIRAALQGYVCEVCTETAAEMGVDLGGPKWRPATVKPQEVPTPDSQP